MVLVDSGGLRVHGVVLVHKVLVIRVFLFSIRMYTSLHRYRALIVCILHALFFGKKLLGF